jgi:hypothetical protein
MSITRIPFPREVVEPALPKCDWVYFATPSREEWTITRAVVDELRMIIRTVYNSKHIAIANVKNIHLGDTILLVYGGSGKPYRPIFSCTVVRPPLPVPSFDAFTFANAAGHERLKKSNYLPDPYLKGFTGISIEVSQHLESFARAVPRPAGNNTIRRWDEVFAVS